MWLFHKHDWKEVSRKQYDTVCVFFSGTSMVTIITYKCQTCGKYKQKELQGWI